MLPQSNVNVNLEPGFFDNNIIAATPDVAVPSTITSVVAASLPSHRPPFEEVVGVGNSNDHHPGTDSNSDPTSVIVSITMTPSPTSTPPAAIADGSPMDAADNPTECQLLGSFAILVQLALGGLALLSLVYKRWRERPQRPVKIWFFDASKQVFGSVLVHGANVFMSLLTSGRFEIEAFNPASAGVGGVVKRGVMMLVGRDEPYVPNPCSFYLLNLGIDTTIGIPILIVIVRATTALVSYTPLGQPAESIQSGNYGNPPNAWWWFKQSIIYFFGLMGMKICVLVMFMALPWLPKIGDWALGWTEGNEKLQIVFVMMLFPLIMNALQYYIIDSYIKKQIGSEDECEAHDHGAPAAQTTAYNELSGSETESFIADDSDEDDPEATPTKTKPAGDIRRKHSLGDLTRDEYDPDTDGDSQTVIGSSSSHISTKGVLQKDLLPKE